MKFLPLFLFAAVPLAVASPSAKLPPPAAGAVDFEKDIKPLFEAACVKCHAKGKEKGGFSLETREAFLKGGDTGPGAVVGKSAESEIVEMVAGVDPDSVMPKKGSRWTAEQVGMLRTWIDKGAVWPVGITFAKPPAMNLQPRPVALLERPSVNPVDNLLAGYLAQKGAAFGAPVEDRVFARRVYLDLIGLLPSAEQLEAFVQDPAADKRPQLVQRLLADRTNYADHWLSFWNDLLRNDYRGTGFIDGGRKQITRWLYQALIDNKPYDRFVAELVNPTGPSEGFSRGIIWRGNVNASMLPPMQAAQNVSQVFLGVNLKCASCHDSFVNDWSLSDAYGLAAVYADAPMDLIHCDKPTGKKSEARFLYPEIGALDPAAPKAVRLERLAEIMTSPKDGRLSRTIVNRLWARLFGRGLVEPLDDMEKPAWDRDLLDWLAEDFVAHGYDLKHTLEVLCTSRAYQLPAVESPREKEEFVFHGPLTRRLTAEQFSDAVSGLCDDWSRLPSSLEFDFVASGRAQPEKLPQWIWTDEPVELGPQRAAARGARATLADAAKNLLVAQKKAEEAATTGGPALAEANAAVAQIIQSMQTAQWYLSNASLPGPGPGLLPESDRHWVVFRKTFELATAPAEAYATLLASQSFLMTVNGKEAKSTMRDGFRNGRIAVFNLQPLLKAGANTITIQVSSHTEKQLNDIERPKYPGSVIHLNAQSGLAFYLRVPNGAAAQEISTDETWKVRRSPEGAWTAPAFNDVAWAAARPLPAGVAPVDEGPSLEPVTRHDFANLPVELGPQLVPMTSMIAQPGHIRAAMLAADPLQVALDRPNREVVLPVRATAATTIQALELTNGATLNDRLQKTATKLVPEVTRDPQHWLDQLYHQALARSPSADERAIALEMLGQPVTAAGVADLLWVMVNHPEFQLIN